VISFDRLAELYFRTHNACGSPFSRQYMSVAFYHNDEQKKAFQLAAAKEQKRQGRKVRTLIRPVAKFYRAEDYHQKYMVQQDGPLMREIKAIYPDMRRFVDSTMVMRLNGYVGGEGTLAMLDKELADYGLSEEAQKRLREYVRRYERFRQFVPSDN